MEELNCQKFLIILVQIIKMLQTLENNYRNFYIEYIIIYIFRFVNSLSRDLFLL